MLVRLRPPRLLSLTFSPATSKTKSTSYGNKQKDTASWSRKSRAVLAHRIHRLQVYLSKLLRRSTSGPLPSGVEWLALSATLTSIQTVHSTFSWTSLQLIWRPITPFSWHCFRCRLGLLQYPPRHRLRARVAPVSTMFLQMQSFYQTALRRTRTNRTMSLPKSWGSSSPITT